ncbi:hypothetical protein GORHZ_006_00220 [Gordonia rhizosphera NBRC 16068]|uniref:Uncharacterized protein n=1 Tax=Gordonia rhizosphera NBRC 16068 TaxID=1108045 RepID=K6UXN0_9ACTN|nr:hypothetical protein GORHZ_006_00220 [Gordonia rhizosphera NBRC 16068]
MRPAMFLIALLRPHHQGNQDSKTGPIYGGHATPITRTTVNLAWQPAPPGSPYRCSVSMKLASFSLHLAIYGAAPFVSVKLAIRSEDADQRETTLGRCRRTERIRTRVLQRFDGQQ